MCYIFLDNGMIEKIQSSSIFLIGKPKITYEQIPLLSDSRKSLAFDISFHKRIYEPDNEYYTDDVSCINERFTYEKNVAQSKSFNI